MINLQQEFKELYLSIIENECNDEFKKILKNVDSAIIGFGREYINLGTDENINPISKLFSKLAPHRINDDKIKDRIFYHFFKRPEFVLKDLLTDNIIQVNSLDYFYKDSKDGKDSRNDKKEYSCFLERINSRYLENEDFKEDKKNQYVFCLTKDWLKDKERFWDEFADNHRGVCVGFRFIKKEESKQFQENCLHGVIFRDVYYDSDCDSDFNLKFIPALNNTLRSNELFKNEILLFGAIEFAKMYKRKNYDWENETRLLINTNVFNKEYKFSNNLNDIGEAKIEKKIGEKERHYFELKTDNCLFKLEIKICSDQNIKLCFDY